MTSLAINVRNPYKIFFIQSNELLINFLRERKERLAIITDDNLKNSIADSLRNELVGHNLLVEIISFPAGENYKTRETKILLENQLLEKNYNRDTCLIAVGGGIVSDLTGFIAATYCRGVSSVYVPTTLLAMADASIGGKTGVNTNYGKNMIGCFYQPKAVFINCQWLQSLSDAEYKNGLVEIIKHALIADAALFTQLIRDREVINQRLTADLSTLLYKNCEIKKNIVEQDEYDLQLRCLLNFGHTIAHAIETIENYVLRHGEAVAIGIIVESYLSLLSGFLSQNDFDRIINLLTDYQLPLQTSAFNDLNLFKSKLCIDKKTRAYKPQFVLLKAIGQTYCKEQQYVHEVSDALLDEALTWAKDKFYK